MLLLLFPIAPLIWRRRASPSAAGAAASTLEQEGSPTPAEAASRASASLPLPDHKTLPAPLGEEWPEQEIEMAREQLAAVREEAVTSAVEESTSLGAGGRAPQHDRRFLFQLGARVKHRTRGPGEVVELMADGRTRVRFDRTGEHHRYWASSMHKLRPERQYSAGKGASSTSRSDAAADADRLERKDVLGMEEAWESGGTKDAPEGRMRHRREAEHRSLVHELNEGHGENAHHHFDAAIGDALRNHTRGARHSTRSRESGSASTPRSGAPELPRTTCLETVLDC